MPITKAGLKDIAAIGFTEYPTHADGIAGFLADVGKGGDVGKAFDAAKRLGFANELMFLLAEQCIGGGPSTKSTAQDVVAAIGAALFPRFDLSKYSVTSNRMWDRSSRTSAPTRAEPSPSPG